jgi:hypothetical protein
MNLNKSTNTNTNTNTNKGKNVSTWIQYEFKDGKIKCLNGQNSQNEHVQNHLKELKDLKELTEKEQVLETMYKISQAIENNRNRYISKYDELHGEGSYERYNCPLPNYYENIIEEEYYEDEYDEYIV